MSYVDKWLKFFEHYKNNGKDNNIPHSKNSNDSKAVEKIKIYFEELEEKYLTKGKEIFNSLPYEDRLALVAYISKILSQHMTEGGTYRYLIYNRFGFDVDAYAVLQLSGLLGIHNKLID